MNKQNKNIFAALVHEHADMLLAFIRATIHDGATVDDIFQETMLIAWRRFKDYDPTRPLGLWLRGIARRLILSHYSRLKQRPAYCHETVLDALEERIAHIGRQPGDTWNDRIAVLEICLEQLPDPLRHCIRMFYQENHKTDEIAQAVNATREAVKKRLQRARRQLADCLRRKGLLPAGREAN